ncbi:HIT family protein [Dactylosporangium sp. CS-047395]|uniref:HIT family protein n=1 Tax=Dactylosporangium sp. CS-047395 TaxID=3239936 RepID=UPI003D8FF19B
MRNDYGAWMSGLGDRVPLDLDAYERRVRAGRCFICAFLDGEPGFEHELLYDDGAHVAFLSRYPTLPGYTLVVPRRHVEDVVRDFTPQGYLSLQAVVHRVARAVGEVLQPERTYLLSLGSMQGNAHVHWHVAPLPPGVPYERQQYHALMAENGVLPYVPQQFADLGARIRAVLAHV